MSCDSVNGYNFDSKPISIRASIFLLIAHEIVSCQKILSLLSSDLFLAESKKVKEGQPSLLLFFKDILNDAY